MNEKHHDAHVRELADLPNINPFPVLKSDAEGRVVFTNLAADKFLRGLGLSRENATRILPRDYPPAGTRFAFGFLPSSNSG